MLHTPSDAIAGLLLASPLFNRDYGFSCFPSAAGSSPALRRRAM